MALVLVERPLWEGHPSLHSLAERKKKKERRVGGRQKEEQSTWSGDVLRHRACGQQGSLGVCVWKGQGTTKCRELGVKSESGSILQDAEGKWRQAR